MRSLRRQDAKAKRPRRIALPALAPARQQVPRRRPRRPDPARDRPRQAVRRRVAQHHRLELGPRRRLARRPVETPKTRSPSNGVCAGWIARTSPRVRRLRQPPRPRLVERHVGRDDGDRRVRPAPAPASCARGVNGATRAPLGPSPPNSSPISNAPAQNSRPPGTQTLPKALTATSAPTVAPSSVTIEADPSPPISVAVIAPVPAPSEPDARTPRPPRRTPPPPAPDRGSPSHPFSPPFARSKRIAAGTIGTTAGPARNPRPSARSRSTTPDAASSPKADPPDSTSASTAGTSRPGASRSVSRVPGAPPRTSTPATNGASAVSTVDARLQPRVRGVPDQHPRHVGDQVARPRPHHRRALSHRSARPRRSCR